MVPGLDVVGDAAMMVDIASMAEDIAELRAETQIAEKFANDAPYTLDQLHVAPGDEKFVTFDAFKKIDELDKRFGAAGDGYEYHHIVEQNAEGDIPAAEINSTRNIVRIPRLLHQEINAEYARIPANAVERVTLRASLRGASFGVRYEEGLAAMRRVGFLQ